MNAMTWWDDETLSIWSQPWGSAIAGPLKDTALTLIPAAIVPWATWLEEHPDTTVLANDLDNRRFSPVEPRDDFVIGVALEESATAYYYNDAADSKVINDQIGSHDVVVFVNPDTRNISVFLRRPALSGAANTVPDELHFQIDDEGRIIDKETGSVWSPTDGVATDGPLKKAILQQIPYVTSFDWAWEDFFPHTSFYEG